MRNAIYILILLLAGCQSKDQYSIQGQLPDKTFDGEFIYLVPFENAVKENVDSAVIKDGKFRIKGVAQHAEIFILRAKPLLRFTLQELLVVKEPGEMTVRIGSNSIVGGTALNDSLQHWKEKKLMADYLYQELKQKYTLADVAQQPAIKQAADSIKRHLVDFNYHFVRNNKDNVVGKFVYKIMNSTFSKEQKMSLNLQ